MNLEVDDFMGWNNDSEAPQPDPAEPGQPTQLSFIRSVDELISEVKPDFYRAVPSRNFLVFEKDNDLTRMFFRQVGSKHEQAAEAVFSNGGNKVEPVYARLYGENPDETISIYFEYPLWIQMRMYGRSIQIGYDRGGKLGLLSHDQVVLPASKYDHYVAKFGRKDNVTRPDHDWGYGYSRVFDPNTGRIVLTKEDENGIERLTIPVSLDAQEIIKNLFPQPLLDNPAEADPSFDDDWKGLTLEGTFGINWEIARPA